MQRDESVWTLVAITVCVCACVCVWKIEGWCFEGSAQSGKRRGESACFFEATVFVLVMCLFWCFSMPHLKLNTLFPKLIWARASPKTTLVQTNFTYANVFFSAALVRDFSATFITEGNAFRGVRGRRCMNLQLVDFQSCGGLQSAEREKASIYGQKKKKLRQRSHTLKH